MSDFTHMGRTTCEQNQKSYESFGHKTTQEPYRSQSASADPCPSQRLPPSKENYLLPNFRRISPPDKFSPHNRLGPTSTESTSVPLVKSHPSRRSSSPSTKRSNSKHPQIHLITQETEKRRAFPREDTTERRKVSAIPVKSDG